MLTRRRALRAMSTARTLRLVALAAVCLATACAPMSAGRGRGGRGAGVGPAGDVQQGGAGRGRRAAAQPNKRIEIRRYRFEATGQLLEYAVYVSSKVTADSKKIPLVIALHGRGAHPSSIVQHAQAPAERGGYIVAAPMGYNDHGWFGLLEGERTTPPLVREYSEKDVLNVLAIMRKEYDIDENRIYLMGQSMGGAGVYFLAVKHPDIWAAVASGAPPLRRATHGETIAGISNIRHIPFVLVHGERDRHVSVEVSRRLSSRMQHLGMTHEYREIAGGGHPDPVRVGAPWMFAFFDRHVKSAGTLAPGVVATPSPAAQSMNSSATRPSGALRNGTATLPDMRAWVQAEYLNMFPEADVAQLTFPIREQDLDFDGVVDVLMERFVDASAGALRSAFLKTPRGYRLIGTFYGEIRPLRAEAGKAARFVIASPMGSGRVHVRLAELQSDGLHQTATAILTAGDSGTTEGNRLYRALMSVDAGSSEILTQIFGASALMQRSN